MAETTNYRPDQQLQPSQYGDAFTVPNTIGPVELPASEIRGADSPEVAQATADAHRAIEFVDSPRLVYTDQQRGDFEVRSANTQTPASSELNRPVDDEFMARRREMNRLAAEQAEARAAEAEQVEAIAWNGQAIKAVRDYAEAYGLAA